jgi:hypothetical protein
MLLHQGDKLLAWLIVDVDSDHLAKVVLVRFSQGKNALLF